MDPAAYRPAAKGIDIVLISSGVDPAALPLELRSRVLKGNAAANDDDLTDLVGYGTYAASLIFQLAPEATIRSFSVYDGEIVNSTKIIGAFDNAHALAVKEPGKADAVLFAVPPSELLDPAVALMNIKKWGPALDAMYNFPHKTPDGYIIGVPFDGASWKSYERTMPVEEQLLLLQYRGLAMRWNTLHAKLGYLVNDGVAVIAPAGDTGSEKLQTIFGIANLPEVVTVGGSNGSATSKRSASGPSFGGTEPSDPGKRLGLTVKPDLVAPTGLVGLLPEASRLAGMLSVDNFTLEPDWVTSLTTPREVARARADSTMTAATLVAVQMGAMGAKGIRNVAEQRGALRLSVDRLPDEPVWRQGMGRLRGAADKVFDGSGRASGALIIDHGDFRLDRVTGDSSAIMHVDNGKPSAIELDVTDFVHADVKGRNVVDPAAETVAVFTSDVVACSAKHALSPQSDSQNHADHACVALNVHPTGSARSGLYCGFLEMKTASSADVLPAPTCFIKGMNLTAHADYIADQPADVVTYALVPTIPTGTPLEHAIMMMPMDPRSVALEVYAAITDGHLPQGTPPTGDAVFNVVLPGYYDVRQMSDYGIPIGEDYVPAGSSSGALPVGAPVLEPSAQPGPTGDLGIPMAYRGFTALVLPKTSCTAASQAVPTNATCRKMLEDAFGADQVKDDPETGGYLARGNRVVFDQAKMTVGTAVASRYIDLIRCSDYKELKGVTATVGDKPIAAQNSGWSATCLEDDALQPKDDKLSATLDISKTATGASPIGVLDYRFKVAQPNYRYNISVNFSFEAANAAMFVQVIGGKTPPRDESLAMVAGPVKVDPNIATGILNGTVKQVSGRDVFGKGANRANFEFSRVTENRPCDPCVVRFILVPAPGVDPLAGVAMRIRDLSIRVDTWSTWSWPATTFGTVPAAVPGRSLRLRPALAVLAMDDGCRRLPTKDQAFSAARTGEVLCEDWAMVFHAPKARATVFDIFSCGSAELKLGEANPAECNEGSGAGSVNTALEAAGSKLYDPQYAPDLTKTPRWPEFDARHRHGFQSPVTVALSIPCRTSGRGKFWTQFKITRDGVLAIPGYKENENTVLEVRIRDGQPAERAEEEGPVPVALYRPLAPPAGFVLAAPAILGRILLLIGLLAAALAAGVLQMRRRARARSRLG